MSVPAVPGSALPLVQVARVGGRNRVVAGGRPLQLRGVGLGGWMLLEGFINGFPGNEENLRRSLAAEIGPEPAQRFFDRVLDNMVAESDIAFIASTGANSVRLSINYRQLEDDAHPFQYKEAGLRRIDQVVEWCERYGLYAVLDLHAAPGWQNPDWHADNDTRRALLWEHPHFQDRTVALWSMLARRYRGNTTIAGYDLLNEPETSRSFEGTDPAALNSLYRRLIAAVRKEDPEHVIILEGDGFASNTRGLEPPPAPNLVYSTHYYAHPAGFGPGPYPGVVRGQHWDAARLRSSFLRSDGMQFSRAHDVPLWQGEFGVAYDGPPAEVGGRLQVLADQARIFEDLGVGWSMWTYKDLGVMGMVHVDPDSPYMQLMAPVLEAKRRLGTDVWNNSWHGSNVGTDAVRAIVSELEASTGIPSADVQGWLESGMLGDRVGRVLQRAWAARFRGLSETQRDAVADSFKLENCVVMQGVVRAAFPPQLQAQQRDLAG